MMTRLGALARGTAIVVGVGVLVLGSAVVGACSTTPSDAQVGSTAPSSSISADAAANLGGKIARAWRTPPSAFASGSANVGGEPPPQGIFAPGDADKIIKKGATKIDVFDEGTGPKVNISSYVLTSEWKAPVIMQVSLRTQQGQVALPPIEATLAIRPLAPGEEEPVEAPPAAPTPSSSASAGPSSGSKAPKPASAAPSAKPAAGAPKPAGSASPSASASAVAVAPPPAVAPATPQGVRMIATISNAKVKADQATVTPKESQMASGLDGSSILFTLSTAGATAFRNVLAPGGADNLRLLLSALGETLSAEYVPSPGKPLGVGGYFMVIDRAESLGIDVVRYRVFKVASIAGEVANLTLELRQYAAVNKLNGAALGDTAAREIPLGGFLAVSKGIFDHPPQSAYPKGSFLQSSTQVAMGEEPIAVEFVTILGDLPTGVQLAPQGGGGDE